MDKKSTYGLTPEQLGRLLSIGSKGADSAGTKPRDNAGEDKASPPPGRVPQIEGYEILSKLGEAGQGQIWRALQVSTNRQVALKVPRGGSISSHKALARFEREIELAAALKHPNIAQIHDSGIHQGIYYYAMDLVEGIHLDEYVKQHNLPIRQILELMRTVCQAIQHAHQKGVIHRDLKPSNIIVTAEGVPYVVDFGLAKNLLEDDAAVTVSIDGEAAGTPAYMSPEQAAGHIDKLDTRTDVYSLGVILFTLLTGESPHDLSGSRLAVMRRIAEEQVRRPRKICPKIDKELELLLLKALDNKPNRRYATAGELARDVDNYLRGAPLIAGPESAVYHVKKFVRRHRALVTGIAAVLLVSLTGTVVSTLFAIGQARARAEAQAVSDFLTTSVLKAVNPVEGSQQETALAVLDLVSEGLAGKFEHRPLIEASVRYELGHAYWRLDSLDSIIPPWQRPEQLYLDPAEKHLEWSYKLFGEQLGEDDSLTLETMLTLGLVYLHQVRLDEAEVLLARTAEISRRVRGEEHERTLWCLNALALVYWAQERYKEAESLYFELLKISRGVFGEGHQTSLLFTGNLGRIYAEQGRYKDAERMYLKLRQLQPDIVSCEDPHIALFISCFAHTYLQQGRYDEAEPLLLDILQNRRLKRGETHLATLETVYLLGTLYKSQSRYDKAESFLLRATWGRRLTLGDEHPDTLETWNSLVELYEAWGKPDKAEEWRAKLPQTDAVEE